MHPQGVSNEGACSVGAVLIFSAEEAPSLAVAEQHARREQPGAQHGMPRPRLRGAEVVGSRGARLSPISFGGIVDVYDPSAVSGMWTIHNRCYLLRHVFCLQIWLPE